MSFFAENLNTWLKLVDKISGLRQKMKKAIMALVAFVILLLSVTVALAAQGGKNAGCTTIQGGELLTSAGDVIVPGYDGWGYNYQARMFNGGYCDAYRDAAWCQPYKDVSLIMKWNDAWLSNMDCNGDGLLDRHNGFAGYIGSGAWLTNHQAGSYEQGGEQGGQTCKWNYFTKIIAAPSDATASGGVWYSAGGTEIGPVIWGEFAVVQEVSNDQCDPDYKYSWHGPQPGFGVY